MRAALLAIGTELLSGRQDSNSLELARRLRRAGVPTNIRMVLPDDLESVARAIRAALKPGVLVLCSGGLGPTSDDVTRQAVAKACGRPLCFHPELMKKIEARFRRLKRPMPAINRVQALIPRGATPLANARGTAPGFLLPVKSGWVAALPGPPSECLAMFDAGLLPALRWPGRPLAERLYRVCGFSESLLMMRLEPLSEQLGDWGMTLEEPGEILIRLSGPNLAPAAAQRRLAAVLGAELVDSRGRSLEAVVGRLLQARGQTLAVAESCTGGRIASRLTSVPGSSAYFLEGVVAYANASKTKRLGVPQPLLARWGAVSAQTAERMAAGVRRSAGADWGLATTGLAGPGGGSQAKPVGLVYLGLAGPGRKTVHKRWLLNMGTPPDAAERERIQRLAATLALNELRLALLDAGPH
ncbi:MAG: CinA family nicotinamide mononucleotide deamidase-related protein [candidate division FCPU426 bacterium]